MIKGLCGTVFRGAGFCEQGLHGRRPAFLFAMLIGVVLVAGQAGTAFADPTTEICKIGDTWYPSVAEAAAVAQPGDEIQMWHDSEETQTIAITGGTEQQPIRLDLRGYRITGNGTDSVFTVSSGAYFTLADTSDLVTGTVTQAEGATRPENGACVNNSGTFCLEGSFIVACKANSYGGGVYNAAGGNFTMTGGRIGGTKEGETCLADKGGGVYNLGSFTFSGGSIEVCTAEEGGGVYNKGSFTLTGNDTIAGAIAGCSASYGGGVYLAGTNSTFTMTGGSIEECGVNVSLANMGGGVYIQDGTFEFSGGSISSCSANYGAGAYIACGQLTMSSTAEISECVVDANYGYGAGVSVCEDGTLAMEGGSIAACSTAGRGAGVYNEGTLTMQDTAVISGCSTTASDGGGGVFNVQGGQFQFDGGEVTLCSSNVDGGGVYNAGTLSLAGGSISKCSANGNGGGIYNADTLNLTGGSISGCSTNGNGGGVYGVHAQEKGTIQVSGSATVANNSKGGQANNLYLGSGALVTQIADFTGRIGILQQDGASLDGQFGTQSGGSFEGANRFSCDSENYFGTVGQEGVLQWTTATVAKIDNDEYFSAQEAAAHAQDGDTIVMLADSVEADTITIETQTQGASITLDLCGHTITGNGAAPIITINDDSCFVLEDSAAENAEAGNAESATSGKLVQPVGIGRGVLNKGTFTMNGGTIANCSMEEEYAMGGGVLNYGSFTMNGGSIEDCKAIGNGSQGGGVYVGTSGSFTMNDGMIKNCSAEGGSTSYGGGVQDNGTFTLVDGTIDGCSSGENGGGVNNNKTFTMQGGSITNCTSESAGGGVSNTSGSTFLMEGGQIDACSSLIMGGGVYNAGNFTMCDGTVSNCLLTSAGAGWGGGVYNFNTFEMTGGSVVACKTTGEFTLGGGVYTRETFNVSGNPVISGNTSLGLPNNVYLNEGENPEDFSYVTLVGDFNGEIYITQSTAPAFEKKFGTATGAYDGAENLISDADDAFFGTCVDGTLQWGRAVARIGTTVYPFVKDAVDHAQSGDTVEMIRDSVEPEMITIGTGENEITLTLDLAGCMLISGHDNSIIRVNSKADFTLTDSKADEDRYYYVDLGTVWRSADAEAWESAAQSITLDSITCPQDLMPEDTVIKMKGGIITGGNARAYQTGSGVTNFGTFAMTGGSIAGCSSSHYINLAGAAMYAGGGSVTTISNAGIIGCSSGTGATSGIELEGGTLYLEDGSYIAGCFSYTMRGAAVMSDRGHLFMNGGNIFGCASRDTGGAITINYQAEFVMNGGSIYNCKAVEGGPSGAPSGGGVDVMNNSTMTMTGGSIKDCSATDGGGVNVTESTLTISGGSIIDCQASTGGGICSYSGTINITGGSITGCNSTGDGGAIYMGSSMNVSGDAVITGNTKNGQNNNVYLPDGKFINQTGEFTGRIGVNQPTNQPIGVGTQFGTTAADEAGDLYAGAENFSNDIKNLKGSAVAASEQGQPAKLVWVEKPVVKRIDGGTGNVEYFSSVAVATNGGTGIGGATSGDKLEMIADSYESGTIPVNSGSDDKPIALDLKGFTITGNGSDPVITVGQWGRFAVTDTSQDQTGKITQMGGTGGGVVNNNLFIFEGGTITGCSAENGGGVYNGYQYQKEIFRMTGGTIAGCGASQNGGGVYNAGTFEVSGDAVISGNHVGEGEAAVESNVYLESKKYISVPQGKTLGEGANIGVTTQNAPNPRTQITTGATQEDIDGYFFSDNPQYRAIIYTDGQVFLLNHAHVWTFEIQDDHPETITANCDDPSVCDSTPISATIGTISGESYVYDGTAKGAELEFRKLVGSEKEAVIDQTEFESNIGEDSCGPIEYYVQNSQDKLEGAPTKVGAYTAKMTITQGDDSYQIRVDYEIAPMQPEVTAPTAIAGLVYTGDALTLVNAGSSSEGTRMLYSLSETGTYSEKVPSASDAGDYSVWYKVEGNEQYASTDPQSVAVSIAAKSLGEDAIISLAGAALVSNGSEQSQQIQSVVLDNVNLVPGEDYCISGASDTAKEAGVYTLTIEGMGNYTGSCSVPWVILDSETSFDNGGKIAVGKAGGSIGFTTREDGSAPRVTSSVADADGLIAAQFDASTMSAIAQGDKAEFVVVVRPGAADSAETARILEVVPDHTIGLVAEISLQCEYTASGTHEPVVTQITESAVPITLTMDIPEELINTDDHVVREYALVRDHQYASGPKAERIAGTFDLEQRTVTCENDMFSDFAVTYADDDAARKVADLIDDIGTVEYTDACKERIDAAREAYDALTDEQKALITSEELSVLTKAEARYDELKKQNDDPHKDDPHKDDPKKDDPKKGNSNTASTGDFAGTLALGVAVAAAIAAAVVAGMGLRKRRCR